MIQKTLRLSFISICIALGTYLGREISNNALLFLLLGAVIGLLTGIAIVGLEIILSNKLSSLVPSLVVGVALGLVSAWTLHNVLLLSEDYSKWSKSILNAHTVLMLQVSFVFVFSFFWSSFIVRTRDAIKISIPYLEFKKEGKGLRPLVIDTSALIDGRVVELSGTPLLDLPIIVPNFVFGELQRLADNADKFIRQKGRRGLDMAKRLNDKLRVDESVFPAEMSVDQRLLRLSQRLDAILVTTDYNLSQVASLEGIACLNLNQVAVAFKSVHLPGDEIEIVLTKAGEEASQGVGYLEDGTMVVVDRGRDKLGSLVKAKVTSALQTNVGRMIFARCD